VTSVPGISDQGPRGNERLTASTAVVLLVLLAAEGLTVLSLSSVLSWHIFIGILLVPVALLKLGSTGYRFVRYYTGRAAYRLRGAPPLFLRLLAPLLVLSTVTLLGSGVGLLLAGRHSGFLKTVHVASFVVFGVTVSVHALAHLRRVPALAGADWRRRSMDVPRGHMRTMVVGVAVLTGVLLATMAVQADGAWVH
jgi:hypothetical protein